MNDRAKGEQLSRQPTGVLMTEERREREERRAKPRGGRPDINRSGNNSKSKVMANHLLPGTVLSVFLVCLI